MGVGDRILIGHFILVNGRSCSFEGFTIDFVTVFIIIKMIIWMIMAEMSMTLFFEVCMYFMYILCLACAFLVQPPIFLGDFRWWLQIFRKNCWTWMMLHILKQSIIFHYNLGSLYKKISDQIAHLNTYLLPEIKKNVFISVFSNSYSLSIFLIFLHIHNWMPKKSRNHHPPFYLNITKQEYLVVICEHSLNTHMNKYHSKMMWKQFHSSFPPLFQMITMSVCILHFLLNQKNCVFF